MPFHVISKLLQVAIPFDKAENGLGLVKICYTASGKQSQEYLGRPDSKVPAFVPLLAGRQAADHPRIPSSSSGVRGWMRWSLRRAEPEVCPRPASIGERAALGVGTGQGLGLFAGWSLDAFGPAETALGSWKGRSRGFTLS